MMTDAQALDLLNSWYASKQKKSQFIESLTSGLKQYGRLTMKQRQMVDKNLQEKGLLANVAPAPAPKPAAITNKFPLNEDNAEFVRRVVRDELAQMLKARAEQLAASV